MKIECKSYFLVWMKALLCLLICFVLTNCHDKQQASTKDLLADIKTQLDMNDSVDHRLSIDIDSMAKVDNPDIFNVFHDYGRQLHFTGQQAKAIELFASLAYHYQSIPSPSTDDYESLIKCYIPLGAAFEELGLKNMAMDYYMQGIEIAEKHDLHLYRGMLLNNIGVIYFGVNDYKRAAEYFSEASTINLKYNHNHELFLNYNNLAEVYLKNNDLTKSMDFSLKALQYLNEQKDSEMYYMMHTNIGIIYTLRKNYPMAISYIKNAIDHQQQQGSTTYLISSYLAIADVYSGMNQNDSAYLFLDKALFLAEKTQNICLQSQALLSQSKVAKRQQDYNKSLLLLEKADILKDSVQRLDNRKKMENWEKVYALEKLNSIDRSVISSWNPEKIFYMMAGIVAILTCIIILLCLIYKHKDKTLKHKELREQQLRQEQSERIAAEEVKSKEMQEEIDQRNRQLTTYTLEKLRLNECLADISNELRQVLLEINPRSKEHKERLQGLLKKLLHLDARNDWEEFQYYFEQVHPRFYEKLEAAFPTLTVKEKRLCAFISLGLSTKEIAAITFREVRSCESSRNRLRKKMGVSPDTDLTAFLRHLTH